MKNARSYFKRSTQRSKPKIKHSLFALAPILINVIAIAVILIAYQISLQFDVLIEYNIYIYYIAKVLITYNVIIAAFRSLLGPILTLLIGVICLIFTTLFTINFISAADALQLIMLALLSFLITLVAKI